MAAGPPGGAPGVRSLRRPVLIGLAAFAGITVLLSAVVALALPHSVRRPATPFVTGPPWLDGWFQFDAGWYHQIASSGYSYTPGRQSSVAFFPTYPMLVRAVAAIGAEAHVAGIAVTVLAGAGCVVAFTGWVWRRLPPPSAFTAVAVLLLYPYSFFLHGAMYADAVFLLTAIGAFLLLERRHYLLAGLVGALATAGRPVGIAVTVGLLVRVLEMRAEAAAAQTPAVRVGAGDRWRSVDARPSGRRPVLAARALWAAVPLLRGRQLAVLVSGLGLAGWCLYLWFSFGDPLAFLAAEAAPGWDQGSGPRTWFKIAFVGQVLHGGLWLTAILAAQVLACLAAVLLLRRVLRRFGWGYLAYSVVVIAISVIGSKDFMGTGRYLLAAFPVIAAAGDLLTGNGHARWLRPTVLAVCGAGLLVGASLYGAAVEVS